MKSQNQQLSKLISTAEQEHNNQNLEKAYELYQQILQLDPYQPIILNNLGCILVVFKQIDKARKCFNDAISQSSSYLDPINNLANLDKLCGNYYKAIIGYKHVLAEQPAHVDALNNLAVIYHEMGNIDKGYKYINRAITTNPKSPDILSNFGLFCIAKQEYQLSHRYLSQALNINPKHIGAMFNLSLCHTAQKKFFIACKHLQYAIDNLDLTNNDKIKFLMHLLYNKQLICDFDNFDNLFDEFRLLFETNSLALEPYILQIINAPNKYAFISAKQKANLYNVAVYTKHHKPKHKITIGYISPDFNQHPICLQLQDMFKHHDRDKFNINCYYRNNIDDNFTDLIRNSVDKFVSLYNMPLDHAAKIIYVDKVDILIDLSGFTKNSCLDILRYRPAAIQCHWLGYMGTLGGNYIDYYIADETLISNESEFIESLICLGTGCFASKGFVIDQQFSKSDFNLPEDKFIFCSFCSSYKISWQIFDIWINILLQTQNSIIWLYAENNLVEKNLRNYASNKGIESHRIIFCYNTNTTSHWGVRHADLYLDPMPMSGGTGTMLALWANVPVITYLGKHIQSRTSSSMLTSLNLEMLIVDNANSYINLAIELYENHAKLEKIRNKLIDNKSHSNLFNPQVLISSLEDKFEQLIREHSWNS